MTMETEFKCYECGEHAVIILIIEAQPDYETGYRDEIPLCQRCALLYANILPYEDMN